ncbi:hypothetical protein [Chelatococcus reniformis]|uniref:hypothetical protein n=1 Tax=Chelatococcus reniformis TaxID=1494448 RepID=UPI001663DE06|nr:hypothetical protein [Chelatococcus reniformis]
MTLPDRGAFEGPFIRCRNKNAGCCAPALAGARLRVDNGCMPLPVVQGDTRMSLSIVV